MARSVLQGKGRSAVEDRLQGRACGTLRRKVVVDSRQGALNSVARVRRFLSFLRRLMSGVEQTVQARVVYVYEVCAPAHNLHMEKRLGMKGCQVLYQHTQQDDEWLWLRLRLWLWLWLFLWLRLQLRLQLWLSSFSSVLSGRRRGAYAN